MESIQLTGKDNNEVYINLNKVAAFTKNGKGTRVLYLNGQALDVKESFRNSTVAINFHKLSNKVGSLTF